MNEPRWYVVNAAGNMHACVSEEGARQKVMLFDAHNSEFGPHRAVQLVDAAELEAAYEQGWREASEWANADDLVCDIDSPAYLKDRARRISR